MDKDCTPFSQTKVTTQVILRSLEKYEKFLY